jgi:hypothetical protein
MLPVLAAIGKAVGKAAVGAGKLAMKGALKGAKATGRLALKGAKRLGKSAIKRVGRGIKNAFSKRSQKPSNEGKPNDPNKGQKGKGAKCANDEICKTINECFASLAKTLTPLQSNTNNLNSALQSTNQNTSKLSKLKQYLLKNYKSLIGSVIRFLNPINLLSKAIKLSIKLVQKMAATIIKAYVSIIKHAVQFAGRVIKSIVPLSAAFAGLGSQLFGMVKQVSGIGQTILDTFTGIPGKLESMFSGLTSLIKSYSPAQAKQIEVAFGQLRATIGQMLVPLAPLIRNIIINITKFIKDGMSKIDIKKVFKWIVFFMFLTVGIIIAGVKLVIKIIEKIRALFQGGGQGIVSILLDLQKKILTIVATVWRWILDFLKTIGPQVATFLENVIDGIFASIGPLLQQAIDMLGPIISEALDMIVQALGWLLRKLPSWLGQLLQLLLQGATWLIKQLPGWIKKLGEYALQLSLDLAEGLVDAIVEYVPKLWDELLNLLEALWEYVKESWRNFINYLPEAISKVANHIFNSILKVLPGWAKRLLGISESASTATETQPQSQQQQKQQQTKPQQQAQAKGGESKQGGGSGSLMDKLGTPEGMMKGIAGFFNDLGLEDVGGVFSDMANMFEGLFEDTGNEGLAYEAKEGTTTSIEDIGKKAREAALGANESPEKKTAQASEQTAQNTNTISQSMQGLASALTGNNSMAKLAQQTDTSTKAIQSLNKTNKDGAEASKQGQSIMLTGIEALASKIDITNEILIRMANSQRQVAEIERSKNYSFSSLNSKGK